MLTLFERESSRFSTLEGLLEVIDSSRSASAKRLDALSHLEKDFGRVVLQDDDKAGSSKRRENGRIWWEAQGRPRSCVALSLIHLVHRLHLQFQSDSGVKSVDEGEVICSQLVSCFTILQGLCLKDVESRRICARKSTLEVILDIIDAGYWNERKLMSNAPAYAIDLLICVTVSSAPAAKLVDSLEGEEIIRALMERQADVKAEQQGGSIKRRAVTLDQVQDNPLAIKCAEFLLFFEYRREEMGKGEGQGHKEAALIGEGSTLLNDSFRTAIDKSFHRQPRPATREERKTKLSMRAKSSSPVKMTRDVREEAKARREDRIQLMRSRPIQISTLSDDRTPLLRTPLNTSPSKSAPVSIERKASNLLTLPFATRPTSTSPRKHRLHRDRGRSQDRSPLSVLSQQQQQETDAVSHSISTNSSPLKSIIGPSPAVQRAHARSLSPVKRHAILRDNL